MVLMTSLFACGNFPYESTLQCQRQIWKFQFCFRQIRKNAYKKFGFTSSSGTFHNLSLNQTKLLKVLHVPSSNVNTYESEWKRIQTSFLTKCQHIFHSFHFHLNKQQVFSFCASHRLIQRTWRFLARPSSWKFLGHTGAQVSCSHLTVAHLVGQWHSDPWCIFVLLRLCRPDTCTDSPL